jgi:Tfp pilus assembly protein PilN
LNNTLSKSLYAWLVPELSSMVPRALRRAWAQPPARLRFRVDGEHIDLELLRSRLFQDRMGGRIIASGSWADIRRSAAGASRRWGRMLDCELAIPLRYCLTLEKNLPKAALLDGLKILRLDFQRSNPKGLEDVYLGFDLPLDMGGGASETVAGTTLVCKRQHVDPHLAEMKALGFDASSIRAFDESGALSEIEITEGLDRHCRLSRTAKLIRLLAVLLVTLLIATMGVRVWGLQQLIGAADAETAALMERLKANRTQTQQSNQAIDAIRSLRAKRAETMTVAETWEELTALLPDSAWITELRIVDGDASIDGFASSASDLIGILSKSQRLTDPEFSAPVLKVSERNVERFQIRMKLLKGRGEAERQ